MAQTAKSTWTDFFTRERARLTGYIRGLLDDAADRDSEDVLQDVMAGIFDKADVLAPIENFAAYTYQAIRNRVVDVMRRRKKNFSLDEELYDDEGPALLDVLADSAADVEGIVERKEIAGDIAQALETLNDLDREIFLATEFQDVSFQELADDLDMPIGTLLSRKSRAMKKLQRELITIDPDHYSKLFQKG